MRLPHRTVTVWALGVAVLVTRAVALVVVPAGNCTVRNDAEVTVPPLVQPEAVTCSVAS